MGDLQKQWCIINLPNEFHVTALVCKILIAILVMFLLLQMSLFVLAYHFYPYVTISETVIPDDYYLQILS